MRLLRRRDVQLGVAVVALVIAVVVTLLVVAGRGGDEKDAARTVVGTPTFPAPPLTTATTPPATATLSSSGGNARPPTVAPNGTALCAAARSGYEAATTYVGAALAGQSTAAQSCVYKTTVPASVTTYLKGKFFVPATTDVTAVDVPFTSAGGTSRITVRTAKEADGRWYVVGVRTG
jgi:hypothetical protein